MRKIRIAIFTFFTAKPLQFKLAMVLGGVLAGLIDTWYITKDAMVLTNAGMLILLAISMLAYLVMFTLYRILQKVFHLGNKLPEELQAFDERRLFQVVGLFGLVPFGSTMQTLTTFSETELSGFASVIIIQGIAVYLGARISRTIKK
ncbi:MAG: hypothetical protein K9M49_04595 [Candidatus Marinimicrobia bacterium]|nr:hypothetical protein [Candidatus Neomarinimicrobiota bacterium]MCF7904416.1 hypothetical protein [Candidatus Neomarinimicrobiota bacterium]